MSNNQPSTKQLLAATNQTGESVQDLLEEHIKRIFQNDGFKRQAQKIWYGKGYLEGKKSTHDHFGTATTYDEEQYTVLSYKLRKELFKFLQDDFTMREIE